MVFKILIIEDETSLARILQFDLENAGYQVVIAHDGLTGLELAQSHTFHCLIVDWMLPGLSGVEIIKKLRTNHHQEVIVLLTAKNTELDVIEGLSAGADIYLKKPFSSRELLAQLKALFQRFVPIDNALQQHDDVTIDADEHQIIIRDKVTKLTKTDFALLQFMFNHKGKLLTRDTLLNEIWGFEYDGSTRIVDVHISQLRTILLPTTYEIRAIHGTGYILKKKSHEK